MANSHRERRDAAPTPPVSGAIRTNFGRLFAFWGTLVVILALLVVALVMFRPWE